MWINTTYINEKNVVVAEPYVMDCSYGIKINDIPIEIDRSTEIYPKEEKEQILQKIIDDYIRGKIDE